MSTLNNHYNAYLKEYARKHRNRGTRAEARIWFVLLRCSKMMGYPFLRQRPIGYFIADFFCKELKLIIEVDGITHTFEGAVERDARRTMILNSMGYSVIRFTDDEVMTDIENVRISIERWIKENRR